MTTDNSWNQDTETWEEWCAERDPAGAAKLAMTRQVIAQQHAAQHATQLEQAPKKAEIVVQNPGRKIAIVCAGIALLFVVLGLKTGFGGGNQGPSTGTPAPTTTTRAEGVTSDARNTSCVQWRGMSASGQSAMASSIISSEQAGGHAKNMTSTWLAANITASCGGSHPSMPAGVNNSTVGQMAALIIYTATVNPNAESEAASANAEAEEGGG